MAGLADTARGREQAMWAGWSAERRLQLYRRDVVIVSMCREGAGAS